MIAASIPLSVFAGTTVSPFNGKEYTHSSAYDNCNIYNGIDVSSHNGVIDWQKVKASGLDYAIIRVGYTGWTKSKHSLNYDANYKANIEGALSAGIPIGVYWYSQALNKNEALAEADKLLSAIKGYNITLPVVFDYEFAGEAEGRLDCAWRDRTLNKSSMTQIADVFAQAVKGAGYIPAIYANKSFLTNNIDGNALSQKYYIWLAHYTTKTDYSGNYLMWQYTSAGKVSGISTSGSVDCNFIYYPWKVTGLKTSARGANGVNLTLSWNAVDGATGYNVYGYNKPADSWTLLDTVTTNKYISPTTPGYEYYFRVAAVNGDVEGTPSDALHTCAACETMDAPSVIASNDKTIQVDWNLVGSHGYVVMWSKDASFKTGVSSKYITGHSKSNYTISVPSGAGQYYVRVRAWRNWETGYVYGSWSEGVKAGQTIAKVTGLKTSARGANGVNLTISWNAQAAADSYNVYGYNKANDSWTLLDTVSTNKYISPTTPGYEYIFRVAAVEDGREGVPSERLHTCAACDTMKAPTVQKSGSQIKVGWELVGSHGYVVMWSTDPTFKTGVSSKYITGHSVNNYTITGINSNQTYYVRVRAWRNWETGYVYGSWSENAEA